MTTSRRNVTRGAAWAIPSITVASAAPSLAASQPPAQPTISRSFLITHSSGTDGCASGTGRLRVTTDNSTYYYRIVNATSSTTVTNVTASVLIARSGLTWTTSAGWSAIKQDPTPIVNNGITYYRYYATLTAPVPAPVNGVISFPLINWYTPCLTSLYGGTVNANGRGAATINGTQQTNIGAWRSV